MIYDRQAKTLIEPACADGGAVRRLYENRPLHFAVSCVCRRTLLRLVGRYADCPVSRLHIRRFARKRGVTEYKGYKSLNAFFTRPRGTVVFPDEPGILGSPCEAYVSAWENIRADAVLQVKGSPYALADLLRMDPARWEGGTAFCFRLESSHHHRLYLFDDGRLESETSIPGRYESVHIEALPHVPGLYAKNHRMVSVFSTAHFGEAALVEVGAMFIGSIVRAAPLGEPVRRGDIKGWFCFGGSSALLFFERGRVRADADLLKQTAAGHEAKVDVGERIGVWVQDEEFHQSVPGGCEKPRGA